MPANRYLSMLGGRKSAKMRQSQLSQQLGAGEDLTSMPASLPLQGVENQDFSTNSLQSPLTQMEETAASLGALRDQLGTGGKYQRKQRGLV